MARKRRRARSKKDSEVLTVEEKTESLNETEVQVEKPQETAPKKEATVAKTIAKPVPVKPTVKKGPSAGQRMGNFLKDVRAEMKKVSWPDRDRTTQSTLVVIFTLVLLSLLMAAFTVLCTYLAEYFFGSARV